MNKYERERFDQVVEDSAATRATVEAIQKNLEAGEARFKDHDLRLRAVEVKTSRIQVVGTVLAVAFGGLMTVLVAWFKPGGG